MSVTGTPAPQAGGAPALSVQAIAPVNKAAVAGGPQRRLVGTQPFVNVLCMFNDVAAQPKAPAYFDALMGNGPGGLGDFFSQASYRNINLNGTVTAGSWTKMAKPKAAYITGNQNPTGAQLDLLFQDCTATIPATVNMTAVIGINLMFNDLLGGVAIGGSGLSKEINGVTKFWASTWMPPWGYYPHQGNTSAGQTVLAHEMGHAFGLPHSAGPNGVTYQNSWDVLSETYNFCGNPGATDPTYGCLGQQMIAQDKDRLQWIASAKKFTYAGVGQTLTFAALADGTTPGIYYAVIPHTGTTTQFTTVEFRRQIGYDVKLPGNAVIIHEVITTRPDPAWVVGTNGGAGAMQLAGAVYTVPNSGGVTVTVNAITGTTASVTIGVPATLQRITVAPNNAGIQIGATVQMVATGNYSDGGTRNLTGSVTWGLAAPGVVTISAGGLVTGVTTGTATVNVLAPPLPGARPGSGAGGGPPAPQPGVRPGTGGGGNPGPLPPRR